MQRVGVLIFMVSMGLSLNAQFIVTPTDSLTATVNVDSIYSIHKIDIINELIDSLGLTWRLIDEEYPEGWNVNLCDLGQCYTGIPGSADMQLVGPGEEAFLKLVLSPLAIVGEGNWHFWVYPTDDPDNYVDLYFSIITGVVGVEEVAESELGPEVWTVGPNPANEILNINSVGNSILEFVQLFNINGSLITELKPDSQSFDVSYLPSGMYLIAIYGSLETSPVMKKIVIE